MRIGLYGGTFDPIHIGHMIVMENSINQMKLDRLIILPSSNPPHKKNKKKSPTNTRVEMVSISIKDNPKIVLSTFESTDNTIRFTHDTINYFKKSFPNDEIFYIMGEDSFLTINTWKNYKDMLNERLIIFSRTSTLEDSLLSKKVNEFKKINPNIFLLNNIALDISSTLIRNLKKEGKSIKYLVRDDILEIINERGLYV